MKGDNKLVPEGCFCHCRPEDLLLQGFLREWECLNEGEDIQNALEGLYLLGFPIKFVVPMPHSR